MFKYFALLLPVLAAGQQTVMYTQYTFNMAGFNPAASGLEINQKYRYVFGLNRQWLDFDNAPKQNFVNFSYTIRPPRSYRFWQNAGVYIENDNGGLIGNIGYYGTYAIHLLVRKKNVLSFGVFAGARKFTRSIGSFDSNDPAVLKTKSSVLLYPDIIPGVRFAGKRIFMDLSAKQITVTKLKDFRGRKIGGPSKLQPVVNFDIGWRIPVAEQVLCMPSIAVNLPIIGPPSINGNLMFYMANRVGFGLAARNTSFMSAIFQIRFLENMTAGFAYSYPVNLTRFGAQNSFEIMVGVVPMGMSGRVQGKHSVAKCPDLSY